METKKTVLKYDVAVKYMPKENITLHLIAHRDDVNYKDVLKNYNECLKEFKQKKSQICSAFNVLWQKHQQFYMHFIWQHLQYKK